MGRCMMHEAVYHQFLRTFRGRKERSPSLALLFRCISMLQYYCPLKFTFRFFIASMKGKIRMVHGLNLFKTFVAGKSVSELNFAFPPHFNSTVLLSVKIHIQTFHPKHEK